MKLTKERIEEIKEGLLEGNSPLPSGYDRATRGMFWEYRHESKLTPIFNLKEFDDKENNTHSMYQLYMQCPTEYDAALVILGSIQHWEKLCACNWFAPHLERWRHDAKVRDAALGVAVIYNNTVNGNTQSAKHLLDLSGTDKKRGRPSNGNGKNKQRPNTAPHLGYDIDELLKASQRAGGKNEPTSH